MAREEYERYFTEGKEVEVRMQREGFRGSWYTATVITPIFSGAVLVTIEYKDLIEEGTENAEKPQKEKDEDEGSENAEKRLRETLNVVHIRPIQPREAKVEFKLNNWVDAFNNGGWWEGQIKKVFGNGRFEVFVNASIVLIEVREEDLRMHQEWVYGDWTRPLLNEEESSSSTTDREVLRTKFLLKLAIINAKEVECFPVKWKIIISHLEGLASSCFVSDSGLNGAISEVFTLADNCIRDRYELAEKGTKKIQMQADLDALIKKIYIIFNDCCPRDRDLMVDRMAGPEMADRIYKLVRNASNLKQCKIGVRSSASSIRNRTAEVIVIAADTMQCRFLYLCELAKEHGVPYIYVSSSEHLAVSCQVGQLGELGKAGKLRRDKKQRGVSACSLVRSEGSWLGMEISEVKKAIDSISFSGACESDDPSHK